MAKKVLIIGTSPRKNGNSNRLVQEFEKGAKEVGNNVETVYLCDKNIGFCHGCLVCHKTQKCVINDDAPIITEKIKNADVVVWATPVYYYSMSGQMKTMIDRANSMFSYEYNFRDIYVLSTSADVSNEAMDGVINGVESWIKCFPLAKLKGVVKAQGVHEIGSIEGHKSLKEAYEMGKSIY